VRSKGIRQLTRQRLAQSKAELSRKLDSPAGDEEGVVRNETATAGEGETAVHPPPPPGFLPTWQELQDLLQAVLANDHIRENSLYRYLSANIQLFYDCTNSEFVACVGSYAAQTEDGKVVHVPVITLSRGAVTEYMEFATKTSMVGFPIEGSLGEFIRARTTRPERAPILNAGYDPPVLHARQRALFKDMIFVTLAHEVGHVCLGSLESPGYKAYIRREQLDISRNLERDADSFASCVITAAPNSYHLLRAQIANWLILATKQDGPAWSGTHPSHLGRLCSAIRNSADAARKLGIDDDLIDELEGRMKG